MKDRNRRRISPWLFCEGISTDSTDDIASQDVEANRQKNTFQIVQHKKLRGVLLAGVAQLNRKTALNGHVTQSIMMDKNLVCLSYPREPTFHSIQKQHL